MGKYINETSNGATGASFIAKCKALEADGATRIDTPTIFKRNLVCVVDNGWFAAAGYCYDKEEFVEFSNLNDYRPKQWYIWNKAIQYAK